MNDITWVVGIGIMSMNVVFDGRIHKCDGHKKFVIVIVVVESLFFIYIDTQILPLHIYRYIIEGHI